MAKIFSIYQDKLIIYDYETTPNQNAIMNLIKNQLGIKKITEDISTSKVYLNKNGELVVKSIEYRLDSDLSTPYKFGLLSDVHIDGDGSDEASSISDLNNALQFFESEGCEFVAYCGDMSLDGRSEDFTALKSCLDAATIPQYTIRGNHDAYAVNNGYLEATGRTIEDYTIVKGNDLFIFMSHHIGSDQGAIPENKITWLSNLFNNNKNKRIFFFYHTPFRGTSGDGGGGLYPYYMLDGSTDTQKAFKSLLENNPNVIFMHGHSHMKFELEDSYPNANHYHVEGQWYDIHVPSCAKPRTSDSSSSNGVANLNAGSQGYVVEVHADKVLFKPRDFIAGEYLTKYDYTVPLGIPLYKFGLLSDPHIDNDGTDTASSVSDLNNAIKFFNDEGCAFIAYCGDMTEDARTYDYTALKSCLDKSSIPNYTVRGNHDAYSLSDGYAGATNCKEDYTIIKNNDLFIFLSPADYSQDTGGLTTAKLDWLENLLSTNTDKRVFLIYHYFINNTAGNANNLDNGAIPCTSGVTLRFKNIIESYSNLIFCNGHSHLRFSLQDSDPNANYYHEDGKCYYIHVPSTSRPKDDNGSGGTTHIYGGSEGYLVEVYADRVLFKPRDFITGEYLMQYAYIVEL